MQPNDLLGLQDDQITDAVDGVSQNIITAEWMGQGDIYMFALRAHMMWKQTYGSPPPPTPMMMMGQQQQRGSTNVYRHCYGNDNDNNNNGPIQNNNNNGSSSYYDTFMDAPFRMKRKVPRRLSSSQRVPVTSVVSLSSSSSMYADHSGMRRGGGRRRRRGLDLNVQEQFLEIVGYTVIVIYILFHFIGQEYHATSFWWNRILHLLLHMVHTWNDFIQSARGW
jgi:hypothetical protein